MKAFYFILILLNAAGAFAQTYSDVASFTNAIASTSPGDTIKLANGIYTDDFVLDISSSGTASSPIVIMSENGGEAVFTGEIGFNIDASYIIFKGFKFDSTTISPAMPTSGGTEGTFIMVTGDYNVLEDLFFSHIALGIHNKHNIILFRSWTHHNTIRRCWFEKATQFGILIYGDLKEPGQGFTGNHTVEYCYFQADRPAGNPNGNEAIRFGSGLRTNGMNGSNVIQHNLFNEYNGEKEIVTLKSSYNEFRHNTIRNSYGLINCRHYNSNKLSHNFFINDAPNNLIYGGYMGIWSKKHEIFNNYFHQSRPRTDDEGAITMMAGNGSNLSDLHESVDSILIKDNIFYAPHIFGAVSFGGRANGNFMPSNVTLDGNLVFSNGNADQIVYRQSGVTGTTFTNNKIYPVGGSMVPAGQIVNPNLVADAFGVFRAAGAGPSGNPLSCSDVGPEWHQCTTTTSIKSLDSDKNQVTIFPNPSEKNLTINLGLIINEIKLTIISLEGKVVLTHSSSKKQQIELDLEAIPTGLYFIKLDLDGNKSVHKLIKQ